MGHQSVGNVLVMKNGFRYEGCCRLQDGCVVLQPVHVYSHDGRDGRRRSRGARDLKLDWIRLKFEDIDLIKPLPRVGNVRTHKGGEKVAQPDQLHQLRAEIGKTCTAQTEAEEFLPKRRVLLHIYDLGQVAALRMLNEVFAPRCLPVGGAFHCGVEVDGLEWCYGGTDSWSTPGIACVEPKQCPGHHYRQTVDLGCTDRSPATVLQVYCKAMPSWLLVMIIFVTGQQFAQGRGR
ncbi:unnamed protein product [Symbiodinium natans]|uniref:PPPDE domain-containing protein n=1 Tax=Symbiodinium natans TaxID=878477 RepID=A0A812TDQ1_9DINO|nr:unnamed protein product [Symbiodinium natans]